MRRSLLQVAAAALVALAAVAAPASAEPTAAARGTAPPTREQALVAEINAVRADHGLRPLRLNASLGAAASNHAQAMVDAGFFGHESQDGTPFWRRVERFYGSRGYAYWSVGENLLWASPDVDAAGAVRRWLDSPSHRKNLLTRRWRELGLAAVHSTAAPGSFDRRAVTVLAAEFGVRG